MEFTAGTKGNIEMIQVLLDAATTIAFRDVPRDTVGSVDRIRNNFLQLKGKAGEYFTSKYVKRNRILPHPKPLKPPVDILAFHALLIPQITRINKPITQKDGTLEYWNNGTMERKNKDGILQRRNVGRLAGRSILPFFGLSIIPVFHHSNIPCFSWVVLPIPK